MKSLCLGVALGTLVLGFLNVNGRELPVTTKTLRYTASWIIDYGDPESSGMSVKDVIDIVSDLQTLTDFSQKLMSEDGTNFIDWIFLILSLLV